MNCRFNFPHAPINPESSIFAASVYAQEITASSCDITPTISDASTYATANNSSTTTNSTLANGSATGPVTAEYWYDHTGKRIKKNESGVVTYYWFDSFEQTVYPNGTTVNTTYYFANGERLAKKVTTDSGSKMYYFHPDHLGSTSVVSDESGNLVEETEYYPYGGVMQGGSEQYLFTGKELDRSTGLYYYGARYYNPELTRFVEADPIIPEPYNPQALNRYAYVLNNPLKYTDPTGNVAVGLDVGVQASIPGTYSSWGLGVNAIMNFKSGEISGLSYSAAGPGIGGGIIAHSSPMLIVGADTNQEFQEGMFDVQSGAGFAAPAGFDFRISGDPNYDWTSIELGPAVGAGADLSVGTLWTQNKVDLGTLPFTQDDVINSFTDLVGNTIDTITETASGVVDEISNNDEDKQ